MATKLKYNRLSPDQTHFLVEFIKFSFPEKENEPFSSNNELRFTSITLHRVFKKYFGFSLSIRNIIYAFEKNDYTIYLKKGDDISIKTEKQADKKERQNFNIDLHSELGVDAIYIKIDGKKIHNYIRAAYDMPATATELKVQFSQKVVKDLMEFKNEWELKNNTVLVPIEEPIEHTENPDDVSTEGNTEESI